MAEDSEQQKPALPSGRQVGDFRILGRLGSGGMGDVYLAEQVSLRRKVALKVLRNDLANDANYLRRFESEARAAAALNHPNIVSVYATGEADGFHFIAMEYVHGITLREYIKRKGQLSLDEFLTVAIKVASALQRAAEVGTIHRDIKPENVMVSKKNEVKVMDFGLARQLAEDVHLTQTGVMMGTPLYMSPEQLHGRPLDPRTDIYSFGVMAYHMLAGRPPFQGETAVALALLHVSGVPDSLEQIRPDIPKELVRIIAKAMAKKPENRYQTAKALLSDLRKLQAGEPVEVEAVFDAAIEEEAGSMSLARTTAWMPDFSRSLTRIRAAITDPDRRRGVLLALLGGLFVVGAALGWSTREPDPFRPTKPWISNSFTPPELPPDEVLRDGYLQILYARTLPKERQESAYWTVLLKHRSDVGPTLDAGLELIRTYIDRRDHVAAEALAVALRDRDRVEQKILGQFLMGIVQSRRNRRDEAARSFESAFELNDEDQIDLAGPDLEWLAREYLAACRRIGVEPRTDEFNLRLRSRPQPVK